MACGIEYRKELDEMYKLLGGFNLGEAVYLNPTRVNKLKEPTPYKVFEFIIDDIGGARMGLRRIDNKKRLVVYYVTLYMIKKGIVTKRC